MPPLLAAKNVPEWVPILIFFGFFFFQVARGIRQAMKARGAPPLVGADRPPVRPVRRVWRGNQSAEAMRPESRPESRLSPAERAAKLERQLRGGPGPRAMRPAPPPLPPSPEPAPLSRVEEFWESLHEAERRAAHPAGSVRSVEPAAEPVIPPPAQLDAPGERFAGQPTATGYHLPHSVAATVTTRASSPLATELARALREPATVRGAILASVILGPPKALQLET